MSRTPEETARLALTVSVNGPEGPVGLVALARETFAEALDRRGRWAPAVALAYCAADLAEARAEVAALREVAGLVREWQAAQRAERAASEANAEHWRDRMHDCAGPAAAAAAEALEAAAATLRLAEARLLAATLPEVSRG